MVHMSIIRIAGSLAAGLILACAGLSSSGQGVLVAERWEQPETPVLAVLLGGRWTDGGEVDADQIRLRCTYFSGASLVAQVHTFEFERGNTLFSCPSLKTGKLVRIPIMPESDRSGT